MEDSTVALYDCSLTGGTGGSDDADNHGADGGSGCNAINSFIFASGSSFQGGDGGCSGMHPTKDLMGGNGGDGVWIYGAETVLLECACLGGEGGPGFPWEGYPGQPWYILSGSIQELTGAAQHFETSAVVREMETLSLFFHGTPQAQVFLFLSLGPDSRFMKPLNGQWLLALPLLFKAIPLGSLSGSGDLTVPVTIPDMGPGFDGLPVYLQPVFSEGGGQQLTLGPTHVLVVVE